MSKDVMNKANMNISSVEERCRSMLMEEQGHELTLIALAEEKAQAEDRLAQLSADLEEKTKKAQTYEQMYITLKKSYLDPHKTTNNTGVPQTIPSSTAQPQFTGYAHNTIHSLPSLPELMTSRNPNHGMQD